MQAIPDARQQSFEEIYGPPENFLEIEVSRFHSGDGIINLFFFHSFLPLQITELLLMSISNHCLYLYLINIIYTHRFAILKRTV